jgi:hypothetical protein
MRFPRINRLRWDKPPGEADRLETLEKILERIEAGRGGVTAPLLGEVDASASRLPHPPPQAGEEAESVD